MTWNAEGMFAPAQYRTDEDAQYKSRRTRRASTEDALAVVSRLDADIITIPEFGVSGELPASARNRLTEMGYQLFEFPYNDEYKPPIGMVIITRLPVVSHVAYRLGERRSVGSVVVQAGKTQLRVIAVHLDDKKESTRMKEAEDLVRIANDSSMPILMMGDFNAMRSDDWFAKLVRSMMFKMLWRYMPQSHIRYVLERLSEMGKGEVIRYIQEGSRLHDLDPWLLRTITAKQHGLEWVPAIRLAKIDWLFASSEVSVDEYMVADDVGSDHRPVIASINIL